MLRVLDAAAPPATILCSKSSGFPIQAISAATDRPDRVVGWHWASPAPVMRFAEIVRTRDTSDATVSAAAAQCEKHPVVVRDTAMAWGYVANRISFAMVAEAQKVVNEGIATTDDIDQLMVDCYRWPAGPSGMVQGRGIWLELEPREGEGFAFGAEHCVGAPTGIVVACRQPAGARQLTRRECSQ